MPVTPTTVTDAAVYANGSLLPSVESVELPDIELSVEEFEQLGMAGAVNVPSPNVDVMTSTIAFASYHPTSMTEFSPKEATQVEVRGSINDMTPAGSVEFPRVINMRCMYMNRGNDTMERNREEGPEIELAVHYYKETIDGENIHIIDPVNRILVHDGTPLLGDRRANLGF